MSDPDGTIAPGDDSARIAVVIVTFNSGAVLDGCLRSVVGQNAVRLGPVVVADNASADDSVTVAEAVGDPRIRTVQVGHNSGYSAAINAGIATLDLRKLDAVFILNPDCRLHPDALYHLARALREPGRGIAVPRILNPDGSLQPSLRRAPSAFRALAEAVLGGNVAGRIGALGELVMAPEAYEHAGPATWATGAAMLVSAGAARELGRWDESFLLYSEETEYCLRAADQGWTVWYEPAAVAEHIGGESGTNPTLYALMTANKVVLFRRRHRAPAAAAYRFAIVLGEAIRAAAGRPTSRAALPALLKPGRRARLIGSIVEGAPKPAAPPPHPEEISS